MGNRINGDLGRLFARQVEETNRRLGRSFARLGAGRRIASAADDPAGLGISERLRSRIGSLGAAIGNTSQGLDFARTAEAGLQEVGSGLGRLRELAVQASNGTLSAEDRATIAEEAQGIVDGIDGLASDTELNGVGLLDGSPGVEVQVGDDAGDVVQVASVDASAASLGIDSVDLSTEAGAQSALAAIDSAIDRVGGFRSDLGASARELEGRQEAVLAARHSLIESESQLSSLDVAVEAAINAQQRLLSDAGIASLTQANAQPQRALSLLQ